VVARRNNSVDDEKWPAIRIVLLLVKYIGGQCRPDSDRGHCPILRIIAVEIERIAILAANVDVHAVLRPECCNDIIIELHLLYRIAADILDTPFVMHTVVCSRVDEVKHLLAPSLPGQPGFAGEVEVDLMECRTREIQIETRM